VNYTTVTQALVLFRSSSDSSSLLSRDLLSCWLTCGVWVYNTWSGVNNVSCLAWNSVLAGNSVNSLACLPVNNRLDWSRNSWLWIWLDQSRAYTSSWVITNYLSWWWVIDRWSWNWLSVGACPMWWVVVSWLCISHMSRWLMMVNSRLRVIDMTSRLVMADSWLGVRNLSMLGVVNSWFGISCMGAWLCLMNHSWWMMCDSLANVIIVVNILNTYSQNTIAWTIRSSSQI